MKTLQLWQRPERGLNALLTVGLFVLIAASGLTLKPASSAAFACKADCSEVCASVKQDSGRALCKKQCNRAAKEDCAKSTFERLALTAGSGAGHKPIDWNFHAQALCKKYCSTIACAGREVRAMFSSAKNRNAVCDAPCTSGCIKAMTAGN